MSSIEIGNVWLKRFPFNFYRMDLNLLGEKRIILSPGQSVGEGGLSKNGYFLSEGGNLKITNLIDPIAVEGKKNVITLCSNGNIFRPRKNVVYFSDFSVIILDPKYIEQKRKIIETELIPGLLVRRIEQQVT